MNETKSIGKRGIYVVLILLLLGANGWLFFNAYKNKSEIKDYQSQISERDSIYSILNENYTAAQLELQTMKGESAEKDALIEQLQLELTAKKNEISGLIQSKNFINKKSSDIEKILEDAKIQIALLQGERDLYISKLDSVSIAYQNLFGAYENLEIEYTTQLERGNTLVREKDSIRALGSIILADNILVSGVRSKDNGKELTDQKAKKADRLKISFDLLKNKLSAGSQQTVYVKIIDPQGLTLFDSAIGSGEFENKENDQDSRYTTAVSMDYAGDESQSFNVYWNQTNAFEPGDYKVMIFHQGYCVGQNTFTLKKSIL